MFLKKTHNIFWIADNMVNKDEKAIPLNVRVYYLCEMGIE